MRVGLYLHFPYCRSRCTYCDFNAYTRPEGEQSDRYLEALERDILQTGRERRFRLRSIFLGGGTPSLYPGPAIERILTACRQAFQWESAIEVTMEANPGTVTAESLALYRRAGVNRLSLGVQTFDPELLRMLNRIHTPGEAQQAVDLARQAGFANLSLDLIYGLPGQTLSGFEETLERALELQPEHLSLYQLTVEPGTHLEAQVRNRELRLPPEERTLRMDRRARRRLGAAGFRRYEISNWCREGFQSRHNLVYWRDQPYLGLGCGATGFVQGWRVRRILHPEIYARALLAGRSPVATAERMGTEGALKDTLMMGLRTRFGIPLARLRDRYPELDIEHLLTQLQALTPGWLERRRDRLRLSAQGADFASSVQLELMDLLLSRQG